MTVLTPAMSPAVLATFTACGQCLRCDRRVSRGLRWCRHCFRRLHPGPHPWQACRACGCLLDRHAPTCKENR